ncbi:MAG TPA: hypothetical protein VGQ84_14780 [Gaiellaceae bacterium]|nr:hypothetical protein [Gaiellaceae bacterium]
MTHLSFLTPEAGLLALGFVLPLVLMLEGERRSNVVRAALRLPDQARGGRALLIGCLVAIPVFLGLGAMQPTIDVETRYVTRNDTEVWFVIDTSLSMVASATPTSATRLERATQTALRLRAEIPQAPAGIASLTDRLLPHVFPTPDQRVFAATIRSSIGIDQPPPVTNGLIATTLASLTALKTQNYYSPAAKRRVAVILTDAESQPFPAPVMGALFRRSPRIRLIFIRVGGPRERVYLRDGAIDPKYEPVHGAHRIARAFATATEGKAFEENQFDAAARALRGAVSKGRTKVEGREKSRIALAPFAVALAFVPLGLMLWQRNL